MVKTDPKNIARRAKYAESKRKRALTKNVKRKLDEIEKTRKNKENSRKQQRTQADTARYVTILFILIAVPNLKVGFAIRKTHTREEKINCETHLRNGYCN